MQSLKISGRIFIQQHIFKHLDTTDVLENVKVIIPYVQVEYLMHHASYPEPVPQDVSNKFAVWFKQIHPHMETYYHSKSQLGVLLSL